MRRASVPLGAALALTGLLASGCSGGSAGSGSAHHAGGSGPSSAHHDSGPGSSGDAHGAGRSIGAPLPTAIPADLQKYYKQKPSWHACGNGYECTRIKVPIDYTKPSRGDVALATQRRKAGADGAPGRSGRAPKKVGSLLVNPGGPGGSALQYLQAATATYPKALTSHFDMVAFDPRGVGESNPISCLSDKEMDAYTATDATPDDHREVVALENAMKKFAAGCRKRAPQLLGHLSTVDAARDMDVVRAALGDPKLNYLGKSYGTFLGATYAELFPSRTGRLVLDGALDPSLPAVASNRTQAGGFQVAFNAFAKDCAARSGCPLGKDAKAAGHTLDALFKKLDGTPLPTKGMGGRKLDEAKATTGVISALYAQQEWPLLRQSLAAALHGDGTALLKLSDQYYERDPQGRYSNLMYANAAVNCLDSPPAETSEAQVRKDLPSFKKASPQFGTNLAWAGLNCSYWKVPPTGRPHRITAKGAAPIVVVGTTRDPATPYAWAKSLASQLDSGRLLTYRGDGHTAYARSNSCVDGAINAFFIDGKTPRDGKTC